MFEKKGVYAIFWGISVLLIGGLVLIFFLSYLQTSTSLSSTNVNKEVIRKFNNVLKLSLSSENKVQKLSLGSYPLQLNCEGTTISYALGKAFLYDSVNAVFSRKNLDANDLLIWTLTLKDPFRINSFTLLSDSTTRYVFCPQGNGVIEQIYEDFKLENKELSQCSNGNLNEVLITNDLQTYGGYERQLIISIDSSSQDVLFGNVTFIIAGRRKTFPFFGKEMLFGAILSDPEIYECSLNLVFNDIARMSRILNLSISNIKNDVSIILPLQSSACNIFYDSLQNTLQQIITYIDHKDYYNAMLNLAQLDIIYLNLEREGCPIAK